MIWCEYPDTLLQTCCAKEHDLNKCWESSSIIEHASQVVSISKPRERRFSFCIRYANITIKHMYFPIINLSLAAKILVPDTTFQADLWSSKFPAFRIPLIPKMGYLESLSAYPLSLLNIILLLYVFKSSNCGLRYILQPYFIKKSQIKVEYYECLIFYSFK